LDGEDVITFPFLTEAVERQVVNGGFGGAVEAIAAVCVTT
jgi:hypothetical protein